MVSEWMRQIVKNKHVFQLIILKYPKIFQVKSFLRFDTVIAVEHSFDIFLVLVQEVRYCCCIGSRRRCEDVDIVVTRKLF
jgi:hypothetical protein